MIELLALAKIGSAGLAGFGAFCFHHGVPPSDDTPPAPTVDPEVLRLLDEDDES